MISVERLPYTWGDIKNGKLGIDLEDKDVQKAKILKKHGFTDPALIPYFENILRTSKNIDQAKVDLLRQKFN